LDFTEDLARGLIVNERRYGYRAFTGLPQVKKKKKKIRTSYALAITETQI